MNNRLKHKGKLALQKQTLRRLSTLSTDEMRRVAGGTRASDDVFLESGVCTLFDRTGRSATGSANCRGGDGSVWG
ncbi:MAG TPA: hypothetical protein VMZ28_20915 [Kofleriaceae bacterium]|nr:hypothetical protein [Kofleriaceae bacterium]